MKKQFDCVEMKHKGALNVRAEIKKFGVDRELEYWKGKYNELKKRRMKLLKPTKP